MPDAKIAPTVAEAQVGDLLWHFDPHGSRYDADGKYEGRGVWTLAEVASVSRLSIEIGSGRWPRKYDRKTGAARASKGYNAPSIRGSQERAASWWASQAYAIARKVEGCRDDDTLKTIAFALGIEGPPDFSTPHSTSGESKP
jgi:hypothetical protein